MTLSGDQLEMDQASVAFEPDGWASKISALASDQDRHAFRDLFVYFGPRLNSYFLRLGETQEASEDLVQETMLALWRRAVQFDRTRGSASGWIFAIARNIWIDHLRRVDRIARVDDQAAKLVENLVEAQSRKIEQAQLLRQAMRQLPPEQANALRVAFLEEFTHSEAVAALNIPLGTFKSRVRRALQHLRHALDA